MGQLHALMEKEGQVPPGTTIHRKIQSKIRAKINELEGIGRTRGNKGFTELEQCYDVLRKTWIFFLFSKNVEYETKKKEEPTNSKGSPLRIFAWPSHSHPFRLSSSCGFCQEIEVPEKKLSINCSFCNTSFCCASCFKHHLQDQCICETCCCLDAKCSKCSKCSCQTCCTRCEKCRNLYHLACRPLFFWCDECHNALCHLCFQQTRRCAKCQSGRGLIRMYDT